MNQRQTFNVTFFCKKTKVTKKGLAPIYARITVSGVSTEIYTQCQIEPEKWNQKAERSLHRDKMSLQINEIISTYRANILSVFDQLIKENAEITCQQVKSRLFSSTTGGRMFLAEFAKYCDKRQEEVGVRITQLTTNKYHRLLRYMTEYVAAKYKQDDISLSQVTYEYIDGLNTFIQTNYKCRNNGAINLLCCLKNFILYAVRNEWIEKNPFQYYKMRIDKTNVKVPLTKGELYILIAKPMPNERLDRVRDVFCFCCLTGLAFTDAHNLCREHLLVDDSGVSWIDKDRDKTGVPSLIPLLPFPMTILKKYENSPELKMKGQLLPVPSNQKMNGYLKELADICGINKNLTTHLARHTFATLAIEYGMPIDIIAKVLGHRNVSMTRHYARISRENISREMMRLGAEMEGVATCNESTSVVGTNSANATKIINANKVLKKVI